MKLSNITTKKAHLNQIPLTPVEIIIFHFKRKMRIEFSKIQNVLRAINVKA